jgi:pyruvate dehydrogenase E2 component (dihydrolipoamide acetyltransferase)
MPARVIMPALELAQDSGKVLQWLRAPGDTVRKGDVLLEIETDKATVEIEAPASGILREVTAQAGDVIPVGQTIALIFGADEAPVASAAPAAPPTAPAAAPAAPAPVAITAAPKASPLARKVAEQHGVDLAQVVTAGRRIEKADVLAFVERRGAAPAGNGPTVRLAPASPKARRLAAERGLTVTGIIGTGPGGAVLAADVLAAAPQPAAPVPAHVAAAPAAAPAGAPRVGTIWCARSTRAGWSPGGSARSSGPGPG